MSVSCEQRKWTSFFVRRDGMPRAASACKWCHPASFPLVEAKFPVSHRDKRPFDETIARGANRNRDRKCTGCERRAPPSQNGVIITRRGEGQVQNIAVNQIKRVGNAGKESSRAASQQSELRRAPAAEHNEHHRSEQRH